MRKFQKEAIRQTATRAGITTNQFDEICLIVSSTCGPLVIGSMIERGLEMFRKTRKPKRKKSRT